MAASLFSLFCRSNSKIPPSSLPLLPDLSSAESPSLSDHVTEEMAKLDRTVRRINALSVDAEERDIVDESIKLWVSELKQAAWEGEGILEDYSYELLHNTAVQEEKVMDNSRFPLNNPSFQQNILVRIDKVMKFIDEICHSRADLGLTDQDGLRRKQTSIRRCTSSLLDPLEVYGREDEKNLVISYLFEDVGYLTFKKRRLKEHEGEIINAGGLRLISIVAMGGMGKTTLARLVYNDARVQNHFDIKAWIWVSEDFDEIRLTRAVIESVTAETCCLTELEPLQRQLHKEVKGKKILLVFDDVWNEDPIKWELVRRPFSATARGSHMIITTRSEVVSSISRVKKVIRLGGLPKDDSWALFCQLSFPGNASRETELVLIGRKIVEKSNGVPLILRTLGEVLSLDTTLEFWNYIMKSDLWELDLGRDYILPILKLSYNCLPPVLKRCFTFLAAFPRGHKFDIEELVRMWCAVDLIHADGSKQMEEVGRSYVHELVRRSFLQNLQLAGSREKVAIHDLIHELTKSIGREETLVRKYCGSSAVSCNSHLRYLAVLIGAMPFYSNNELVPLSLPVVGQFALRSLSFHSSWRAYLRSCVKSNFRTLFQTRVESQWWFHLEAPLLESPHLKYLRILDVSSSDQIKLDKSVGVLHHLKYLGMCQREIPLAVCKLYKLQTLLNSYPFGKIHLPRNVVALSNLRHLVLPSEIPLEIPSGIHRLTNLQSLSTFTVGSAGSGAATLDEIKEINTLQGELCILDLQNMNITLGRIFERKDMYLSKKKFTRLKLVWNPLPSHKGVPHDEAVLEHLQPHCCIQHLVIHGYRGMHFPAWLGDKSFLRLQDLELCKSYYCDHLPPLGQLPSLKQLKLASLWKLTSIGPEFYGNLEAPFRSLETLVLQNLVAWEEWWLPGGSRAQSAFPRLRTMEIRGSHKLICLPISDLHALSAISVSSCSTLATIAGLQERCEMASGKHAMRGAPSGVLPSLQSVMITACPSLEESLISLLHRQKEISFSYWEQSSVPSATDIADFGYTPAVDCGKELHVDPDSRFLPVASLRPFARAILRM